MHVYGAINRIRTLYIESVMTTMEKQWLAEWVIPNSVIRDVVDYRIQRRYEIDREICRINDGEIKTTRRENKGNCRVKLIDIRNKLFKGKLAIVTGGSVRLVTSNGEYLKDIVSRHNGVIGINAGGFNSYKNGIEPSGLVIEDGIVKNNRLGMGLQPIGFNKEGVLKIGSKYINELVNAVECSPGLIVNGEIVVKGTEGYGINPRTAIGQTMDGELLLLVIDGRKPGYSIGASVEDCAKIMEEHAAINAACLDGGSSSDMVFGNRSLNNKLVFLRRNKRIINAFIVQ